MVPDPGKRPGGADAGASTDRRILRWRFVREPVAVLPWVDGFEDVATAAAVIGLIAKIFHEKTGDRGWIGPISAAFARYRTRGRLT